MKSMKSPLMGVWRVVEFGQWGRCDLDDTTQIVFLIPPNGLGETNFLGSGMDLDCRFSEREGRPTVEFTFEGFDERSLTSGRGFAILEDPDTLKGRVFIHQGDEAGFVAHRARPKRGGRRRRDEAVSEASMGATASNKRMKLTSGGTAR
jgi:hypothetical protein